MIIVHTGFRSQPPNSGLWQRLYHQNFTQEMIDRAFQVATNAFDKSFREDPTKTIHGFAIAMASTFDQLYPCGARHNSWNCIFMDFGSKGEGAMSFSELLTFNMHHQRYLLFPSDLGALLHRAEVCLFRTEIVNWQQKSSIVNRQLATEVDKLRLERTYLKADLTELVDCNHKRHSENALLALGSGFLLGVGGSLLRAALRRGKEPRRESLLHR